VAAARITPVRGAPVMRSEPARPASVPSASASSPRTRSESPWDPPDGHSRRSGETVPDRASGSPPRGFARALTPPPGDRQRRTSTPPSLHIDGSELRPPTDPEIETYLEMEAELPPEPGSEGDLESELALRRALAGDLEEHESVSITIEEEGRRVIETTTETEGHTLTVTVTESYPFDERQRAITAEDGHEVSGSISIPEDTPPPPPPRRRAKRQSGGWDD
jgi:hypothetical protein